MANPRDNKPVLHTKKHIARLERERFQTRLILIAFVAILVSVVGLIGYAVLYPKYFQPRMTIARVGNVNISLGEWQARVRLQRTNMINQLRQYQLYAQYLGMDLSQQEASITSQLNDSTTLGQVVIDQMIDEEVVRQEAAKRGMTASSPEVDTSIQSAFQFYPNGSPTPTITPTVVVPPTLGPTTLALVTITPTPTAFLTPTLGPTATLNPSESPTPSETPTPAPTAGPSPTITPTDTPEPTSTPYTLQGFQTEYKTYVGNQEKIGMTDAQVRQLFETNILRTKLMDIIAANVEHTKDEVWARHILVADEATANKVRALLLSGEDFAKVAAQYSTDTGTKDKGGDVGWFGKGAMVAEFETAAYSLKVGEISQPIKSQFGYHIIQVLARGNVTLDGTAFDTAKQTAFNDWLKQARTEYKVVTYNNWQDLVPTDPAIPATAQ